MAESLVRENERLRAEDAVLGVDALDETLVHPILASTFEPAGIGVHRERHFPTPARKRPKNSERERCDLVLTEEPGVLLIDPVEIDRQKDVLEGTLFAPVQEKAVKPEGIDPADAFWIEIKVCGQIERIAGVPVPNTAYTTGVLRAPARDIRKLARERAIRHAASALILFAASEEGARHDLKIAVHKWLDESLPIRTPAIRVVPIDDRIGNTVAAVCLTPVRCGESS